MARAPGSGWTVTLKIDGDGDGRARTARLHASADLTDGSGAPVGHRELTETVGAAGECAGLARATSVWAGLALEAAAARVSSLTAAPVPAIGADAASRADAGIASGWPPPAVAEPPSPEHDRSLHHEEGRSLELGAGVFLMSGSGGGALSGPVLFAMIESAHGIFLRPSLAIGQTVSSLPPSDVRSATWGAGRLDTCLRLPGLYSLHQGMQLDVCAGGDAGMTHIYAASGTDLPYLALGPSVELHGELGGRLSALLRGAAGIDLLRGSYVDNTGATQQPPLASVRLELALSWDVQADSGARTTDTQGPADGDPGPRPWVGREQRGPRQPSL